MAGNCAPTYNFYNCCCDNDDQSASQSTQAGRFVWNLDSLATVTGDKLGGSLQAPSVIDADMISYRNLTPLHCKVKLIDISVARFSGIGPNTDIDPSYSGWVNFDVVVLDYFGNYKRTISSTVTNYKLLPDRVWTPIALSVTASDLEIAVGELVAGRVVFGAPDLPSPKNLRLVYMLSGTAEFM